MKHNHEHRENAEYQRHHAPSREGREPSTEPVGTAHPERPHAASHIDSAHRGHDAHDKHAGHSVEMFRSKFWVSLALTIPTVLWGHMLMRLTGYQAPVFPGSQWIAPIFGTAVFLYGGRVFLQGGPGGS